MCKLTTLLLVRHGESEANRSGIFAGNLDADLQDRGLVQAKRSAEYIAENYKVDAVYASDLKRAYKTGKAIADRLGLSITTDSRLREIRAGEWDGKRFSDLPLLFPNDFSLWMSDIGNSACTGGESVKQLSERIMSALTDIAEQNDGKTLVIATHATPIRVAQTAMSGLPLDEMQNIPWVSNCSVTETHFEDGKWTLVKIGIDEHLADLRTSLPKNV